MKTFTKTALLLAGVCTTGIVFGQQNSYNDRYDDRYNNDNRSSRRDERRYERQFEDRLDERRQFNERREEEPRYNNRYEERMGDGRRSERMYDESDLSKAYDQGFEDGQQNVEATERQEHRQNYKHFTFGVYAGANSTSFEGETIDTKNLTGRLGYQLGFFVRGGGRIYGQIGAEYLTSSSQFYKAGDGQAGNVSEIIGNIDQRYLHIPALIGFKVAQSDRGVSGIRLQVGAEYATPLSTDKNDFNLGNADFQAATINGLAGLGFDAGPIMLDFVYHYGFADVLSSGNSKRRILGVNLGFKF